MIHGVPVSPGRAVGLVVRMPPPVPEPTADPPPAPAGAGGASAGAGGASAGADAADRIAAAAQAVMDDLFARAAAASGTAADILTVTAAMAADPSLVQGATRLARDGRLSPARAVWQAAGEFATQLEALGGMMAERARDVRDVRDRIVAVLLGLPTPGVPTPGRPFVLVADDLAPADTATLDPTQVLAIVTAGGGPTSHTAILARSLGIPAVVACPGAAELADGVRVLVDGGSGAVDVDPSEEAVAAVLAVAARPERVFDGVGHTADRVRVQLLANVADPAGATAALAAGAEGVGLFRTEFCFLGRAQEPSVEEQVTAYRGVLSAFAGKKVVIRTLDAGADKPLPFVTADDEPNPALGVRGLRTSRRHPEVLDRQLAAIAAAAGAGAVGGAADVWVMAPMVATAEEARDFVARCTAHGLRTAGVMIEVPAAALGARWIFEHAAFGSLGTNDLTQYTMAADRELGDLAGLSSAWNPAVLALIKATCEGAAAPAGGAPTRPVGVCGEAAADPALAAVLVGLGVDSLSMTPRALADVAAVLAATSLATCRDVAALALAQPSAEAARTAVRAALPVLADLGL